MELNHLCMGCMEEKGDLEICPLCGHQEGSSPDSPLHMPPRSLLKDKYLIGQVLGQGGFGITYLVWDKYLDRKLAIKEFFPREIVYRDYNSGTVSLYSGNQTDQYKYGLSKFLAEAKNLAQFENHPSIVSVKDFFEDNATAYMVMNYIDGVNLNDFLENRNNKLTYDEALQIILPVLDALRAVHEIGLLHRDISPDNIMITVDRRVMLLDFGAARHALGEKGKKFSVIVKQGYAPEEQYRSNGIQGSWTDVYSAAATFYKAITGRMLPDALDRMDKDMLVPPSQLGVRISPSGEAALLKALAVRSDNRFRTVAEFQQALILSSQTIQPLEEKVEMGTEAYTSSEPVPEPVPGPVSHDYSFSDYHDSYEDLSVLSADKETDTWDKVRIGRATDNDLTFTDSMVSRYHAEIYNTAGKWYINDLNSTHGTFINGVRASGPVELLSDSMIQLSRNTTIYFKDKKLLTEKGDSLIDLRAFRREQGQVSPGVPAYTEIIEPANANSTARIIIIAAIALLGIFALIMLVLSFT